EGRLLAYSDGRGSDGRIRLDFCTKTGAAPTNVTLWPAPGFVGTPPADANGTACTSDCGCASGFCVDGDCCNTDCRGSFHACQACSIAAGAAVNGTCGPVRAGTLCRAANGCDRAEVCDGSALTCPPDSYQPAGTPCRAARGPCDVPETCDGLSGACPADKFAA